MTANWPAIEVDYRAGAMSLREIAAVHEVPEATLRKRAKVGGWERVPRHITNDELRAAGAHALARRLSR